jgi:hypothetical protein
MQYSPKLKNAMSEIKQILEKHDIAGLVVLHTEGGGSQGFAEYLLRIDPSYSVAKFERPDFVRFRAKLKEDFNGNKRLMEHKLAATANMLNILSVKGGELSMGLIDLSERFDKITDAEHGKGTNTSQWELDN